MHREFVVEENDEREDDDAGPIEVHRVAPRGGPGQQREQASVTRVRD